jgi:hypothetical protein
VYTSSFPGGYTVRISIQQTFLNHRNAARHDTFYQAAICETFRFAFPFLTRCRVRTLANKFLRDEKGRQNTQFVRKNRLHPISPAYPPPHPHYWTSQTSVKYIQLPTIFFSWTPSPTVFLPGYMASRLIRPDNFIKIYPKYPRGLQAATS